jgi:uncharacterized oligopeptide transporter (OPT) family protein
MTIYPLIITCILSVFSTAILGYISMAIMIGPWIEPTIVLLASLILSITLYRIPLHTRQEYSTLITAGASLGGIIATGCGFCIPTLYFINPALFNSWLESPFYFSAVLTGVCFLAGGLGLLLAHTIEKHLLINQNLPFPIGQLSYKMVAAQNNTRKSLELAGGFILTLSVSIIDYIMSLIPRMVTLIRPYSYHLIKIPALQIPLPYLPMLWSMGFVTGHVIALPLALGILSKIFILVPAHAFYFSDLSYENFSLAFCGGLVMYSTMLGFTELPHLAASFTQYLYSFFTHLSETAIPRKKINLPLKLIFSWILFFGLSCLFFWNFGLSPLAQCYVILFVLACAYQLTLIGGKIGLAPAGRFATFIMVPGILFFGFNEVQATLVATFFEVCGGVAVDALFGKKMGSLAHVPSRKIVFYQIVGLIISSLAVGIIFWLLIRRFGLGSEQLFAQRGRLRALMFNVSSFNFFGLILGALYAAILKDIKINSTLVLGGILMPLEWSFTLTLAGFSTYFVKDKETYYPFWSGVFAANSLWMLVQALL